MSLLTRSEPAPDLIGAPSPAEPAHRSAGGPGGSRWRGTLSFLLAVLGAAAVSVALRRMYPDPFSGRTDIIGYPAFANFNSRVYFVNYFLLVLVFPAVTVVLYVLVDGLWRRLAHAATPDRPRLFPATTPAAPPADPESAAYSWPVAVGRTAFVGIILAASAGIAMGATPNWLGLVVSFLTVGYAAAVYAVAWMWERWQQVPRLQAMAGTNAMAVPLVFLALVAASEASTVRVVQTGQLDRIRWLPVPVVCLLAVTTVVAIAVVLGRASRDRWPALERWMVLVVAGPVAVWLLISTMNLHSGWLDFFHEGELLAATRLVTEGAFPWRDVLFIHGLFGDVVPGLLARELFGDTRWAAIAANAVVIAPVYWLGNYFLCVYLFRRNWLLLLASQMLVVLGAIPFLHFRFVLQAYLLLLLAALLRRVTWPRAAAFTLLASVQLVMAPEASYFSLAAAAVVVAYELVHREPGIPLVVALGRTVRCLAVGVVSFVGFFAFLGFHHAIRPFFDYYRTFVSGHELSGAFPIQWTDRYFEFWVYAPVAVILIAWWYAAVRLRSGHWLTVPDWVVAAAVIGLVPYYTKFLSRADGHIFQVAALTVIPLFYVAYRLIESLEGRLRRHRIWAWPVSAGAVVAVVVFAPVSAGELLRNLPARWQDQADHVSSVEAVGYEEAAGVDASGRSSTIDPRIIGDVDAVLDAYLGDRGRVFDFSNNPALFGFLLDHRTATRYFHVSMAIPEPVQRDLIAELERDRPEIVVYDSVSTGLPAWDGVINPVRHYLVSAYLLDNYKPLLAVQGYLLMRRADIAEVPLQRLAPRLSEAPATGDLFFGTRPCDWGYAPTFLALEPSDQARRRDLAVAPAGSIVAVRGWAVDHHGGTPAREVLVVVDGQVAARMPTGLSRPDVEHGLGRAGVAPSGFGAEVQLTAGVDPETPGDVRLFGLTEAGEAGEVRRSDGTRAGYTELAVDGAPPIPVVPGAVDGYLEGLELFGSTYVIDLPADARRYDWLEIDAITPFDDDQLTLSDPGGAASHAISFRTLPDGSRSARVMVGNCPQWFGYSRSLVIRSAAGAELTAIRLIG